MNEQYKNNINNNNGNKQNINTPEPSGPLLNIKPISSIKYIWSDHDCINQPPVPVWNGIPIPFPHFHNKIVNNNNKKKIQKYQEVIMKYL